MVAPEGSATANSAKAAGVKVIEPANVVEQDGFMYEVKNGKATMLCPKNPQNVKSKVVIPETVAGVEVQAISADAFYGCSNIEAVLFTAPIADVASMPAGITPLLVTDPDELNDLLQTPKDPNAPQTYTITVNFLLGDTIAAEPYTGSFAAGSDYEQGKVNIPMVIGYKVANIVVPAGIEVSFNDKNTYMHYSFNDLSDDKVIKLYYEPDEVQYTIKYYKQNVTGYDYTLVDTQLCTGLTNDLVAESDPLVKAAVRDRYLTDGFYGLNFETPTIAADSSTVLMVYYDRYYYLVSYHLLGGTGVDPVYDRVGASIAAPGAPTRPGYDFLGWFTEEEGGQQVTLVTVMPAQNVEYYAHWLMKTSDIAYSVDFWYENADDDDYTRVASITKTAPGGSTVSSNDYRDYSGADFGNRDETHFTYNEKKAETQTVASDGSTILNVYFTRNVYTFRFLRGTGNNKQEQVGVDYSLKYDQLVPDSVWKKPADYQTFWIRNNGGTQAYSNGKQLTTGVAWNHKIGSKVLEEKEKPQRLTSDYITFDNVHEFYLIYYDKAHKSGKVEYYLQSLSDPDAYDLIDSIDVEIATSGSDHQQYYYSDGRYIGFTPDQTRTSGYDNQRGAYYATPDGNGVYKMYYNRIHNNLMVKDVDATLLSTNSTYGAPLGDMTIDGTPLSSYVPANPIDYPDYTYQIGGWYTTPDWLDGTEIDMSTATMTDAPLIIYAKWERIPRQVDVYLTADLSQPLNSFEVPSGLVTPEDHRPADPVNGQYTFAGWFYMSNGIERAFVFDSMPVNQDMKVYAKWSSNVLVPYTVNFKYIREDNDECDGVDGEEIATSISGMKLAGTSLTFEAKVGDQLLPQYRSGYFPVVNSHTMVVDMDEDLNEYTFVYHWLPYSPYTVRYINAETGLPMDPAIFGEAFVEKHFPLNTFSVVTEYAPSAPGFMVDAYQKRLVLTMADDGDSGDNSVNIITFNYTPDVVNAMVTTRHILQNNGINEQHANDEVREIIGTMISRSQQNYKNYMLDYVKVYDGTIQEADAPRIEAADWNDATEIELTDKGLNYVFYYKSAEFYVKYETEDAPRAYRMADPAVDVEHFNVTAGVNEHYYYAGMYMDEAFTKPYITTCGMDFEPQIGKTYYVKELPFGYLQPKIVAGYRGGLMACLYIVTALDDTSSYQSVGFIYNDEERSETWNDTVAYTMLRLKKINSDDYIVHSFTTLYPLLPTGYLAIQPVTDYSANDQFSYRPFFVTRDGVMVKSTTKRTVNTGNLTNSSSGLHLVRDASVGVEISRSLAVRYAQLTNVMSLDEEIK